MAIYPNHTRRQLEAGKIAIGRHGAKLDGRRYGRADLDCGAGWASRRSCACRERSASQCVVQGWRPGARSSILYVLHEPGDEQEAGLPIVSTIIDR